MDIQTEELRILEWACGIGISGGSIIIWWMWNMLVKKVQVNQTDCDVYQRDLTRDLNDHKIKVAEKYAEKDALERIHDRIDDVSESVNQIRTFLMGNKHV